MSQTKVISFFEQVVTYLLVKAGCLSLPIDLEKLAGHLQVKSIEMKEMAAEGFVEADQDGYRIALKQHRSRQRTNFSLAHELGHVIMHRLGEHQHAPLSRQYRIVANVSSGVDDEAIADAIAGLILLPPWSLSEALSNDFSLRTIVNLANTAGASVATCLIRSLWHTTHRAVGFHARIYDNKPDTLSVLWTRAARSLPTVGQSKLLDLIGKQRLLSLLTPSARSAFAQVEDDGVGAITVHRRYFDSRQLIYGLWTPSPIVQEALVASRHDPESRCAALANTVANTSM